MGQLKALIFDVDGTLAETEEYHRRAFNDAFKYFNLPWTWDRELYLELLRVTGGKERILHYQRDYLHVDEMPSEEVKAIHEYKSRRYDDYVGAGAVSLRPGVKRLIMQAMQNGVSLGIATTTSLSNVNALLIHTLGAQSLDYFAAIAAGDMVENKKPAPDIYILALQLLGCQYNEVVAIEDSRNGLLSAHGAKIATVITVSEFSINRDFEEATAVVDHLGDEMQPSQVKSGPVSPSRFLELEWFEQLLRDEAI